SAELQPAFPVSGSRRILPVRTSGCAEKVKMDGSSSRSFEVSTSIQAPVRPVQGTSGRRRSSSGPGKRGDEHGEGVGRTGAGGDLARGGQRPAHAATPAPGERRDERGLPIDCCLRAAENGRWFP